MSQFVIIVLFAINDSHQDIIRYHSAGPVAQWITRLTTDQKIPGSSPGRDVDVVHSIDNDRLSKLHLPTGRIKRRIRQLKKVEDRGFCALNVSQNGMIVIGVMKDGRLFAWNKNTDIVDNICSPCSLESVIAEELRLQLFVSDHGDKIVLSVDLATIYVWHKLLESNRAHTLDVRDQS
ncbi:uncharacterized protein LOC134193690 [Corticium candelabrum]|uniref:uncharacterized protein LOC134193690 n=1 Tax=Corticium candelabrum TaxID=121492 RepID=UPI002E26DB97|nr:uncharacterized protein LOC134193690 [Corticium candelabrum]